MRMARLVLRISATFGLTLVGIGLIGIAYLNLYNIDEQPYWLLVAIALAGAVCLVAAGWIGFHTRRSKARSPAA